MSYEDERIVKMTFDNESFKKGVSETIKALDNLEKELKSIDTGSSYKSFDTLTKSAEKTNYALDDMEDSVGKVKVAFSSLQIIGISALSELTRSAMTFGKKLYSNTLGQIISGGSARALNLENAKFQIEGLGKTWGDVEEDINYGVKDTAYGLDAAAKAASMLLASQVQTGEEMKAALRGISGVAAMTNSSYEDIANVFTDAAGAGRLMGDQLMRLGKRGLNATSYLKQYYNEVKGVAIDTEQAMRDFVSKGKVSFKEFAAAMDWAFGEHAKEANKTFTGALSNMRAALSRVGELFITPWREMYRLIYLSVTPAINKVKYLIESGSFYKIFKGVTKELGLWSTAFFKNENFLRTIYNIFVLIDSAIYNIVKALNELHIGLPDPAHLAESLNKLTSGLILTGDNAKKFRTVVKAVATVLMIVLDVVKALFYAAQPLVKLVFDFLQKIANNTDNARDKLLAFIGQMADFLRCIAELAAANLPKLIESIANAFKKAVRIIAGVIVVFSYVKDAIKSFASTFHTFINYILKGVGITINTVLAGYRKIKEVFEYLGKHLDGFKDDIKSKASTIKDTLSDILADKVMNAKIALSIDVPKIDPKSIIQNDAINKLRGVSSKMEDYESAAGDAAKNTEKLGYTGGKFLRGAFTRNTVVSAEALSEFAQYAALAASEAEDTADSVDKSSKKMADSVTESTNKMNSAFMGMYMLDGENASKAIKNKEPSVLSKIGETAKSVSAKVAGVFSPIKEHFTNFFAVITDIITAGSIALTALIGVVSYRLTDAIINNLNVIPDLFDGLSDLAKSYKYEQMSYALNSMFKVLLAFAAVLGTIAIISLVCDAGDFKKIINSVSLLAIAMSTIAQAAAAYSAVGGIKKLIEKIPTAKSLSKVVQKVDSFSEQMKALAIVIATFAAAVIATLAIAHFVGPKKLMLAFGFVTLMLVTVIGGVIALNSVLNRHDLAKQMTTLDLRSRTFTRSSTSAFAGIQMMMMSLVPIITSMSAAVFLISSREPGKIALAFAGLFLMLSLILGSIFAIITTLNKTTLKDLKPEILDSTSSILKKVFTSISIMIMSISGFLMTFAAAILILTLVNKIGDVSGAIGAMVAAFAVISIIISSIMFIFLLLDKQTASGKNIDSQLSKFQTMMESITKVINAVSGYLIAFAGAMAIISMVPNNEIWDDMWVLVIAMAMMGASILLISVALKDFARTTKGLKDTSNTVSVKSMESIGKEISTVISAMSVYLLAVASAAGILSMVKHDDLIQVSLVLAGAMVLMVNSIILLSIALRTVTVNSKKFGQIQNALDGGIAKQLQRVIMGMAAFIAIISVCMVTLSKSIPRDDLLMVGGILAGSIIAITGAIGGLILLMNHVLKTMSKNTAVYNMKNLMSVAASFAIFVGSLTILLGAVGLLAIQFDAVSEEAILGSLATTGIIFLMLTATLATVSNLIKENRMPSLKDLSGFIAITASLSTLFIVIAGFTKIISECNWDSMEKATAYLLGFGAFVLALVVVLSIAAEGLSAGVYGLLAVSVAFVALGALLSSFGLMVNLIANSFKTITETFDSFEKVNWTAAKAGTEILILCLKDIAQALFASTLSVASAFIFGLSIKMIVEALAQLSEVDKASVIQASTLLAVFARSITDLYPIFGTALVAAAMFGLIGPLILGGMVTFLAAIALIPSIILMIVKTIDVVEQNFTRISTSLNKFAGLLVDAFKALAAAFSVDMMKQYSEWLIYFFAFSLLIGLSGIMLMTGAVTMALAAIVMTASAAALYNAMQAINSVAVDMDILKGVSTFAMLGIFLFVIGTLLMTGSITMAIGAGMLLLAGVLLKEAMEYFIGDMGVTMDVLKEVSTFAMLGIFLFAAGTLLMIGSSTMFVASVLLTLAGIGLWASMTILEKAINDRTIKSLTVSFAKLAALGVTATLAAATFNIAGALFLIFGATMLVGGTLVLAGVTMLIAAGYLIELAAGMFAETAETFISFGEYIIEGLLEGLSSGYDMVVEAVGTLADAIKGTFAKVLEINSPSEVFAMFGKYICDGLSIGIDENSDEAQTSMNNMGSALCTSASGWGDKIKNLFTASGENSGKGFANKFVEFFNKGLNVAGQNGSKFSSWWSGIQGKTAGQSLVDIQNQRRANEYQILALQQRASNLIKYDSTDKGQREATRLLDDVKALQKENEALQAQADYYLQKQKNEQLTEGEYTPPSFDQYNPSTTVLPDVTTPEVDKALEENGNGSGSNAALASDVGSNVGSTITNNNNYNFIQNNYSPEPIDRTELYTQTENQHYSWYKWLRDNS